MDETAPICSACGHRMITILIYEYDGTVREWRCENCFGIRHEKQ